MRVKELRRATYLTLLSAQLLHCSPLPPLRLLF